MFNLGDEVCRQHGWLAHAFIHESAHAVAAVDRGLAFESVSVITPDQWTARRGAAMAGGVEMSSDDAASWVLPDPAKALEFVLAGSIAEHESLGHALANGHTGDVEMWKRGARLLGDVTPDQLAEVLGEAFEDVVLRITRWVRENFDRIRTVVQALAGVDDASATSHAVVSGRALAS